MSDWRDDQLIGRAITGVLGERALPERIEGGPGIEPAGSGFLFAKSDLIYWHLYTGLWLEVEGLSWIFLFPWMSGIGLSRGRVPEPGWHIHPGDVWRESPIDAPAPFAALVGATITAVTPLYCDPGLARPWWRRLREYTGEYDATGYIFETTKGSVAVAGIGEQYAVGDWPDDARWHVLHVVTDPDPSRIPRP